MIDRLAEAGFKFDGENIICEYCGLEIGASLPADFDPLAFHKANSERTCQYLTMMAAREGPTGKPYYN